MKEVSEIDAGLKGFVALRVILTTVLLGGGAIVYFKNGSGNKAFFLVSIMALIHILSLLYLLLYPIFQDYQNSFKKVQIAFDIGIASTVIYITGGKSSPFIFLYALIIIFTNIMLTRIAGYITAAASAALYLLIVFYQFRLELSLSPNEFLLSPMVWGEKGLAYISFNLTGFLLIAMLSGYLSERIRVTRKELRESNESLAILKNLHENILQSLTSGVITLDLQGRLISINKTALEILGIMGEDEVVGKNLSYLMPELEVEELLSKRRQETLHSTPDGRKFTLGFSSSILRDTKGEMKGYIIIFQDLTEVKKLEERLRISEKMALMGQLSGGLAHQIRNPLSAISGAVEVLGNEVKPSEENIRLLNIATQEVEKLNLLVENFLLFTGPIQKPEVSADISRIIDKTVESFSSATHKNGLQVVVDTEKELYVQVDPHRLRQVIWNLLLNAMQAMSNGGKIMVEAHLEKEDVVIKVSDEGCGIDERLIPRIFEPFFTTKEGGTGFGLAIVQKVVECYNGNISVISSENKGTTFIITLPKAKKVNLMRSVHQMEIKGIKHRD